jgi:hypothetical protein
MTIPVNSTGAPMPININGFPLSQLSVAPRLIPISQTGPMQEKKDPLTGAITAGPNAPHPNASPNITRINFPNPTAIYAYNVMFSAPNNATGQSGPNKAPGVSPTVTIRQAPPVAQMQPPPPTNLNAPVKKP